MSLKNFDKYIKNLKVKEGKRIVLKDYETAYNPKGISKEEGEALLQESITKLSAIQDKLYAHNEYSMLIVFQAMDGGGKDGTIRNVMSGLNPQGVKVTSFKVPSSNELEHDYFWRHYRALPARGEIGIFNRSHYENVLVTKVHPDYILNEKLPNIKSVNDIDEAFWDDRYKQINRFEKNLVENGTIILKFFLHLSKEEQKNRFLERIDNPNKNWKFSLGDLKERAHWDEYQNAYETMLNKTSTDEAPWFVIPADNKWSARLAIIELILNEFENLEISYPQLNKTELAALKTAKESLENE